IASRPAAESAICSRIPFLRRLFAGVFVLRSSLILGAIVGRQVAFPGRITDLKRYCLNTVDKGDRIEWQLTGFVFDSRGFRERCSQFFVIECGGAFSVR